jgi:hypothetical protein
MVPAAPAAVWDIAGRTQKEIRRLLTQTRARVYLALISPSTFPFNAADSSNWPTMGKTVVVLHSIGKSGEATMVEEAPFWWARPSFSGPVR